MKKFKKIVALATAMTLAMAPTVVSAAATTSTGASVTGGAVSNGKFEGWIDMNVFSYELPTQADDSLEFIVDPQNLIDKSNDANSTGAVTAGAVGVYFENNSAYAASSDALVVKNYSSMDVDVSIAAKVTITSADSVKLVTAGAVTKDIATTSSALDLCIAINQATTGAVEYVDNTSKNATLTATMAALDADNFQVADDGNGGYKYEAKSGTTDVEIAEFYFTGSCNTAADWSAAKDMKAKLEVVWTVARGGAGAVVTAYGVWENGATYMSADLAGTATFDGLTAKSQITNFKLNGVACDFTVDGNGWVSVTDEQANATNPVGDTWTFTFTFNGKNYKAVVV